MSTPSGDRPFEVIADNLAGHELGDVIEIADQVAARIWVASGHVWPVTAKTHKPLGDKAAAVLLDPANESEF